PTDRNAHPQVDCTGRIAVIHNGIIENHRELRAALEKQGHAFVSDTDTEVVAHLIEERRTDTGSFLDAVRAAAGELTGGYALVVVSAADPGELVGVRVASPLVVGMWDDGEAMLASDIPALLGRDGAERPTIFPVGEGWIVSLTAAGVAFTDLAGEDVVAEP